MVFAALSQSSIIIHLCAFFCCGCWQLYCNKVLLIKIHLYGRAAKESQSKDLSWYNHLPIFFSFSTIVFMERTVPPPYPSPPPSIRARRCTARDFLRCQTTTRKTHLLWPKVLDYFQLSAARRWPVRVPKEWVRSWHLHVIFDIYLSFLARKYHL